MGNTRLNITIPESLSKDINFYAKELNEKKSHIITSALEMYFDYLDLKVAQKRVSEDDGKRYSLDEVFEELGV